MNDPVSKSPVAILMGSASDHDVMQHARETLRQFGIDPIYRVASAHRTPGLVAKLAGNSEDYGIKIFIAGAGGAAHLAGVIAAHTVCPVIGVPITSALDGLDSLLSTVQMPGGIPVATVAIGKAGAKNAALLAVEMLAINDSELRNKLLNFRKEQEEKIINTSLPE
ncbi:MAG: 5-(carboxyamino)imidazole ribonucleotide mutase [Candidatus Dadabacteria bacterium]|nr:MAG: 5-(carboxyamino)imidazole ribonucleotide mutase [Candidatus Dadabacteria bacterium]